jgi:hypothetical protein
MPDLLTLVRPARAVVDYRLAVTQFAALPKPGVEVLQPPGGDISERQFTESRVYGAAYVAAVGVERAFVALVCV